MARIACFLFCAISAIAQTSGVGASAPPQQTLVAVGGFPADALAKYQQVLNLIQPLRFALTEPATPVPATINVALSPNGGVYSTPGEIFAVPPSAGEESIIGADYIGFVHEMQHQGLPPAVLSSDDPGLTEGLATVKVDLIYLNLRKQNPLLFPINFTQPAITPAVGVDKWNNLRAAVYGGANSPLGPAFYGNWDNEFLSSASLLADMATNRLGGNCRQLDTADNANLPKTHDDFLALLDATFPNVMIDGVKLSTFMQRDVTAYAGAIAGESYFGIRAVGSADQQYEGLDDDWPFNPEGYLPGFVAWAKTQWGEVFPNATTGTVKWGVQDASGQWLVDNQTAAVGAVNAMDLGTNKVLNPNFTEGNHWYRNYPTGGYLPSACIIDATGNCSADPRLNDSDAIAVVNEELNPGDVAVITNGPWGKLSDQHLTVIAPIGVTVEAYNGLRIFRGLPQKPDGSFEDLTVTNGTQVRTFTPDRFAPMARTFTNRPEPIPLALTRATDFAAVTAFVPGSIYSLWGYGLTGNDPAQTTALPLPTNGCPGTPTNDQGQTEVAFTTLDGKVFDSPFFYCSFGQLNVQIPQGLGAYLGQSVMLSVIRNGTPSMRTLTLTVASSDPAPFIMDFTSMRAAASFAWGPKVGQLVTPSNQAAPGDIIAIWATGLGSVVNPVPDGNAAGGADQTTVPYTVTIGGVQANVLYAGLAPGFVGLYQVNVQMPAGVPSGNQPVVIAQAGATTGGVAALAATPTIPVR
jgi:uncharacterized protein (TIGR03437 family)